MGHLCTQMTAGDKVILIWDRSGEDGAMDEQSKV